MILDGLYSLAKQNSFLKKDRLLSDQFGHWTIFHTIGSADISFQRVVFLISRASCGTQECVKL